MNTKDMGFWTGIAVLVVVAGALLWYMANHPAPGPTAAPGTAQSAPGTVHEGDQYYTIDATFPTSTPLAASAGTKADEAARAAMEGFVNSAVADFKAENIASLTADDIQTMQLGQDGRQYALDIEYTSTSTPATTSYIFTMYQDTLGAHPNGNYQTFTFDNKTGYQVSINNIFLSGSNYLNRLSQIARQALPTTIASEDQTDASQVDTSMIDDGTQPTIENFSQFYFANDQLVIIFPPYQVGPYALGTVLFPIPTSQLKDILQPAYQ